jgi:hypothetical protein
MISRAMLFIASWRSLGRCTQRRPRDHEQSRTIWPSIRAAEDLVDRVAAGILGSLSQPRSTSSMTVFADGVVVVVVGRAFFIPKEGFCLM